MSLRFIFDFSHSTRMIVFDWYGTLFSLSMGKFMMLCLAFLGASSSAITDSSPSLQKEMTPWAPPCPSSSSGKIPRLIPDPTNCRSVFVCTQEGPRRYYCLKGYVFNALEQECVTRKACPKENEELTAFTSCPEKNGMKNILFPHPTDCHMFYQCDHGTAYPRGCPSKLHFNPELKVCDWPYRAKCKARLLTLQP